MADQPFSVTSPASVASSISLGTTDDLNNSQILLNNDSPSPSSKNNLAQDASSTCPASKTDKPRPHVCGTCGRSFARLEHLKRHERSHTKEKPFECSECTRCFARRDLLLRHQQKLHMTAATPTKPSRRRDSASGLGPNTSAKVRKNSIAGAAGSGTVGPASAGMRPRASTISHVDGNTLSMLAVANRSAVHNANFGAGAGHGFASVRGFGGMGYRGMAVANGVHGVPEALPRIMTEGAHYELGDALRTAPPNGGFDFDHVFAHGHTINPAQLHLDENVGLRDHENHFDRQFPHFAAGMPSIDDETRSDWMLWYNNQISLHGHNRYEQAIGESSPLGMSTSSPGANADAMLDGSGNMLTTSRPMWSSDMMPSHTSIMPQLSVNDPGPHFPSFGPPLEHLSSDPRYGGNAILENVYTPHPTGFAGSASTGFPIHYQPTMAYSSDGTSVRSGSLSGSGGHSSLTSISTDLITDVTRQALIISLSQPSVFASAHRRYSSPIVGSPLSPGDAAKGVTTNVSLPSTVDLQRYINAYIHYFHPHVPFLHIPTLTFEVPGGNANLKSAISNAGFGPGSPIVGRGCLILAMTAIGALYEFERAAAKELFDAAKSLMQLYLEERRKSDLAKGVNSAQPATNLADQNTPLWLVQAMLLNVVYGHTSENKITGDIASTHCTSLVNLARAADLLRPQSDGVAVDGVYAISCGSTKVANPQMGNDGAHRDMCGLSSHEQHEQAEWRRWAVAEERKRTLYAIFHMSSLIVSGYNHAPTLMNSEIQLDLPCEEDLWCTPTAQLWAAKGGAAGAEHSAIPFSVALSHLLTAGQNVEEQQHQAMQYNQPFGSSIPRANLPQSDLKPSTFGCLVLINALHNYIWETRQRHSARQWTTRETESMHAHIEPALRAWQAAWAANPSHSLERPNPFGQGPLSADSIPLLDLAYLRLFVNLGSSKEAFWDRKFDQMAEELARGPEIVQHAENSGAASGATNTAGGSRNSPAPDDSMEDVKFATDINGEDLAQNISHHLSHHRGVSKRERHLRQASFYAADSLNMADKLGVTFADFNSRELPVQSALCTFDCAQVLAEWVATVQERVGRYLGILGRDEIDYARVPAIMLLEDEDCKLLEKISDIVRSAETKMNFDYGGMPATAAMVAMRDTLSANNCGYGSKILLTTAYMLEKAAVWPVTSLMAHGLVIQAMHMTKRAEVSAAMR